MKTCDARCLGLTSAAATLCESCQVTEAGVNKPCSTCHGKGRILHWPNASGDWMEERCQQCQGTGKVREYRPNIMPSAAGSAAEKGGVE